MKFQKTLNKNSSENLKNRILSEKEFHKIKYEKSKGSLAYHYNFNPTYIIFTRMKHLFGQIQNKIVVEYGCGSGWITTELAKKGAILKSFDISAAAIHKTNMNLSILGLEKQCKLQVMAAEFLGYKRDSFDVAIGFAILHHLDLKLSIEELYRILKPNGEAYFAEPLIHNPIIRIYRLLTPFYRTRDERALDFHQIKSLCSKFSEYKYESFYLVSIFSIALLYIPFMRRYYEVLRQYLFKLDRWLFYRFPFLRKYAWYILIYLKK
jgi:SAM-dependent methyltransferase